MIPVAFTQDNPQEKVIQAAFDQYRSQFIVEKLFVHTDKNTYISREICWFRIYYTDAFYNKPATISKIAYVELLDKNNLPVLQQKSVIKTRRIGWLNDYTGEYSFGNLSFQGIYQLDEEFQSLIIIFEKYIRIINPQNLQDRTANIQNKTIRYSVFP